MRQLQYGVKVKCLLSLQKLKCCRCCCIIIIQILSLLVFKRPHLSTRQIIFSHIISWIVLVSHIFHNTSFQLLVLQESIFSKFISLIHYMVDNIFLFWDGITLFCFLILLRPNYSKYQWTLLIPIRRSSYAWHSNIMYFIFFIWVH